MGVFVLRRRHFRSFALEGEMDAKTIARRRDSLMSMKKKISARKLKNNIGQSLQVMLEGPSKETDLIWEARLEGMAPEIDGKVYVTEFERHRRRRPAAPGTMATIEITESKDYDLIARAIEFEAPAESCGRQAPRFAVPHR